MLLAEASANTMSTAVTSLMGVVSTVMTTITGNETLMVFFCAGVVGIAIGVVKKLRTRQKAVIRRWGGAMHRPFNLTIVNYESEDL